MSETWQGARSEKSYILWMSGRRASRRHEPMDGFRASWDARFILFCMSASQNQIVCMFLHTFINAHPQKLHDLDTENTSRNRAFANHFLFAHSANAWYKLAVRYRHVAYTGHAVSFRDARSRHNFCANYVYLPKQRENFKLKLGNCSPLFAVRQLISHRQFLFSSNGCKQWENIMWFKKKRIEQKRKKMKLLWYKSTIT